MELSSSKEEVLERIVKEGLENSRWCIFGSTDSALRGLDEEPNDIDIIATEEKAEELADKFSDEFEETIEVGVSQIDVYSINGEELEVIYSKSEKGYQEPLVDFEKAALEKTSDLEVPILPVYQIIEVYRKIDKEEAAERLEKRL